MTDDEVGWAQTVTEPLCEVSHRARKHLLIATLVGFVMSLGGVVSSEIAAFGLNVDEINRDKLLLIVAGVTAYLWIAFLAYGLQDINAKFVALFVSYREHFEARVSAPAEPVASAETDTANEDSVENLRSMEARVEKRLRGSAVFGGGHDHGRLRLAPRSGACVLRSLASRCMGSDPRIQPGLIGLSRRARGASRSRAA